MLMERSQALIGLIAVVVIGLGTIFALAMTRGIFDRGHEVTAHFADAAGLTVDDQVLVAGVRSGRVLSVELQDDGLAHVTFVVSEDLPNDTVARITIQNLLGRRQLQLVAGTSWDELLTSGDVIPVERTRTPVDVPEFGEETEMLAREADEEALQAIVTALADITEGQREEVDTLLDGLKRVSRVVSERRDELEETIVRSEEFFAAFRDRDDEIVRIVDAFGSTLDMLADRRPEIEQMLSETAAASEVLADLVEQERSRIDSVLANLNRSVRVVDRNQVDIAHFFAYAGVALEGFASVGRSGEEDNPFWANMRVQDFGPAGVDALFACGGVVDRALDDVFGPDPRTCEEQDAEPLGTIGPSASGGGQTTASLSGFFRLHQVTDGAAG